MRCHAAACLARWQNYHAPNSEKVVQKNNQSYNPWVGLEQLVAAFNKYFCRAPAGTSDYLPMKNDFTVTMFYRFKLSLVDAIAKVRSLNGRVPALVWKTLSRALQFNSNEGNIDVSSSAVLSDAHYKGRLIVACARACSSQQDAMILKQNISICLSYDAVNPSPQYDLTKYCLRAMSALEQKSLVPPEFGFQKYAAMHSIDSVRMVALDCISRVYLHGGAGSPFLSLLWLLKYINEEPSPAVRRYIVKIVSGIEGASFWYPIQQDKGAVKILIGLMWLNVNVSNLDIELQKAFYDFYKRLFGFKTPSIVKGKLIPATAWAKSALKKFGIPSESSNGSSIFGGSSGPCPHGYGSKPGQMVVRLRRTGGGAEAPEYTPVGKMASTPTAQPHKSS